MKILVAEDCPITRRVLERNLIRWGYETTLCADGVTATSLALAEDAPRLVILDWMMPGRQGPEVCRAIRQAERPFYTYIIFLTANANQEASCFALEAGADDFLCKPVAAEELRQRIRAGARIVELQDRLLKSQADLRELAQRDYLTSLLNRRAFMDVLMHEIARAKLSNRAASVIMLDLDHFKKINDTWGHAAGDDVLRTASILMSEVVGELGAVARFGGEEFSIVLPQKTLDEAVEIAEELRQAIASYPFYYLGNHIQVTTSLGIASTANTDPNCDVILHAADTALYHSKRSGRNRVSIFDPAVGPSHPFPENGSSVLT